MDQKLARGIARSLLRSVSAFGDIHNGPLSKPLKGIMQAYLDGGIRSDRIVARGFELRDQIAATGPCPTSFEVIRHPTRKRILVESVRPVVIDGVEQNWLVCASTLFDLGRDELGMVEVVGHVAVSQHAIARLYERGRFRDADLASLMDTVTLWAVPLLQVMDRKGWQLGSKVAIPFMDGLLLGTLEANPIEPHQGPTVGTIGRGTVHEEYLYPAFGTIGEGVMVLGINTFVGAQELFENQQELRLTLQRFEQIFGPEMQKLRAGLFKGLPDPRMVERFGRVLEVVSPDDLENLRSTLERFFGTPEWITHAEAHRRPKRFLQ
jgi:hypothetical protein